jgi:hypothetical protein
MPGEAAIDRRCARDAADASEALLRAVNPTETRANDRHRYRRRLCRRPALTNATIAVVVTAVVASPFECLPTRHRLGMKSQNLA